MEAQEQINAILGYLGMNATEFSKKLGMSRSQGIFDMQSGKTRRVTRNMAQRIKKAFPAFSEKWLLGGEGEMLVEEMPPEAFSNRSPQVVAKVNIDTCLSEIQKLNRQLHEKDRQIAKCLALIEEKDESIKHLTAVIVSIARNGNIVTDTPKGDAVMSV